MIRHPQSASPPHGPEATVDPSIRLASGPDAHGAVPAPPADRLAYRLAELAKAFGISRRTLERERSAGRFPKPDLSIGKAPLWTPATIRRWIDGGGA